MKYGDLGPINIRNHYNQLKTFIVREELTKEFASIINKHSLESDSNTPGFILAAYLVDCLINYHLTESARIIWYNPEGK